MLRSRRARIALDQPAQLDERASRIGKRTVVEIGEPGGRIDRIASAKNLRAHIQLYAFEYFRSSSFGRHSSAGVLESI